MTADHSQDDARGDTRASTRDALREGMATLSHAAAYPPDPSFPMVQATIYLTEAVLHVAEIIEDATAVLDADEIEAELEATPQPCGSYRVIRWIEGNAAEVVWCWRRSGPCPFPGSNREGARGCAAATERPSDEGQAPCGS